MDHELVDEKTAATFGTTEVLISLLLITVVSAISVFKWKQRNLEKAAAKFPGPPTLPIIGNALVFLGKPEDIFNTFHAMVKQYKSPARFWLGPNLVIYVGEPADIQIVLNSRHALEKAIVYKFLKEFAKNGLVTASAATWREHRRAIQPVFNSRLLEQFIPVFNKYTRHLVDKLRPHLDSSQFDIAKYIATLSLDIICDTALGVDENTPAHLKTEFEDATHRGLEFILMRTFKFWLYPDIIFYPLIRLQYGYNLEKQLIHQVFHLPETVIKQKKEEFRLRKEKESCAFNSKYNAESKSKVFIDILLELSHAGANFSDEDIRDEVITMILAGYDTSAQTIIFCILMLAMHQDIQEKVYKEVFEIFGDSDRYAVMDDLKQMPYTEMVIKETLRMYPTVPLFLRTVTQDIDLKEHKLPAGCTVAICLLALHMDPKVFPNPEQFNPENFTPEKIAGRHNYSYVPFSGGPRNCIGSAYGMLSMKTVISTLVRNYRFDTDMKKEDIILKSDIMLRSANGYPVKIVKRK